MSASGILDQIDILGIPVTVLDSYSHAVSYIVDRVRQKQKTFCVAINPEKIYRSQSDTEFKELVDAADLHICDGIGVVMAAMVLHGKKIIRITGIQLFLDLIARAEEESLKVFLLGASAESNEGAYSKLREMHPGLQITGRKDGYFENDAEAIEKINHSGAEMLFVAMGSPKQEKWIRKYRNIIDAPYCMGIGGTLDVVSGHAKWAPTLFRKTGTEFLYRLICKPKRLKRQICYPVFMLQVIKTRLFGSDKCLLK